MLPLFKRTIAALLGLWLALCGAMPALAASGEADCGVAACCVRKAEVTAPCSAKCCLVEGSAARPGVPALPATPPVNPIPEWVPLVWMLLDLPNPRVERLLPLVPSASCGSTAALPLFLRDRVFLI